jgi:hypothetical protein
MSRYRHQISFESHDPTRLLPQECELVRREAEDARHLVLRILSFVIAYRDGLEPNGRPACERIPYMASLGRWSVEDEPLTWMECLPVDWKTMKKISTKASSAEILLATDSLEEAQDAMIRLQRDYRPGRFKICCFDTEVVREMCALLSKKNHLAFLPDAIDPKACQLDFNQCWFETSWQEFTY